MAAANSTAPPITLQDCRRFWSKVASGEPGECWPYLGYLNKHGYGQFSINGRIRRAHIIAYFLATGVWPAPLCVLHRCDNRRCMNPDHLWLGTDADNVADRDTKGRGRNLQGEEHGCAKLTETQVLAIRTCFGQGMSKRRLAADFGVSRITVRRIVNGTHWKHL